MRRAIGIVAGLALVNALLYVAGFVARRRYSYQGDEGDDEVRIGTIMEGREFHSRSPSFEGGSIVTVCGGTMVDLAGATMAPGGAFLELRTVCGGLDLVVPAGWRLQYTHDVFAGGLDDRTDRAGLPADAPLLTIHARTVLGGVAIRTPRPEEMVSANGL